MGSCLSVEEEEQKQRENKSSSKKPGTVSKTDILCDLCSLFCWFKFGFLDFHLKNKSFILFFFGAGGSCFKWGLRITGDQ